MVLDFDSVARQCAPNVSPVTLRAMAQVESSMNPHAIGIVNGQLVRQPSNLLEAISTAQSLKKGGYKFSAGIVQIYVGNWDRYNLDHESVFDPCSNLRASAGILANCYQKAGRNGKPAQAALRDALSCYYSNNFVTGYQHGYVQKVVAAAMAAPRLALGATPMEAAAATPLSSHQRETSPTRALQP